MTNRRRLLIGAGAALLTAATVQHAWSAAAPLPEQALRNWMRLVLRLVRHTATYSPPVASRTFAYLGIIAFEAAASGNPSLKSLSGQLTGLTASPRRESGAAYDEALIIHAALARAVWHFFGNTGPTGQRVLSAFEARQGEAIAAQVPADVAARSRSYGEAVAAHVLAWSESDGGAVIENMGFPVSYKLNDKPSSWVPTSALRQQQFPLLPGWGTNRSFAMPDAKACGLPPPPAYSEDPSSDFYRDALEVYEARKTLSPEQKAIARFWADDPMLSPTPPGHWIAIALTVLEERKAGLADSADLLARLGVTLADSFIACWHTKFEYDLLRPVTYIRRHIDKTFEPLLITPPFPEYPSGHSTQSGAAATVLTAFFGENFAFTDDTHSRDGLPARSFPSFWAAAEEAGISRLYGGIHFQPAITRGLEQGRCIGAYSVALKTRT